MDVEEDGGVDQLDKPTELFLGETKTGEVALGEIDTYRFNLSEGQTVTVTLQPLDNDQDLFLLPQGRADRC